MTIELYPDIRTALSAGMSSAGDASSPQGVSSAIRLTAPFPEHSDTDIQEMQLALSQNRDAANEVLSNGMVAFNWGWLSQDIQNSAAQINQAMMKRGLQPLTATRAATDAEVAAAQIIAVSNNNQTGPYDPSLVSTPVPATATAAAAFQQANNPNAPSADDSTDDTDPPGGASTPGISSAMPGATPAMSPGFGAPGMAPGFGAPGMAPGLGAPGMAPGLGAPGIMNYQDPSQGGSTDPSQYASADDGSDDASFDYSSFDGSGDDGFSDDSGDDGSGDSMAGFSISGKAKPKAKPSAKKPLTAAQKKHAAASASTMAALTKGGKNGDNKAFQAGTVAGKNHTTPAQVKIATAKMTKGNARAYRHAWKVASGRKKALKVKITHGPDGKPLKAKSTTAGSHLPGRYFAGLSIAGAYMPKVPILSPYQTQYGAPGLTNDPEMSSAGFHGEGGFGERGMGGGFIDPRMGGGFGEPGMGGGFGAPMMGDRHHHHHDGIFGQQSPQGVVSAIRLTAPFPEHSDTDIQQMALALSQNRDAHNAVMSNGMVAFNWGWLAAQLQQSSAQIAQAMAARGLQPLTEIRLANAAEVAAAQAIATQNNNQTGPYNTALVPQNGGGPQTILTVSGATYGYGSGMDAPRLVQVSPWSAYNELE